MKLSPETHKALDFPTERMIPVLVRPPYEIRLATQNHDSHLRYTWALWIVTLPVLTWSTRVAGEVPTDVLSGPL